MHIQKYARFLMQQNVQVLERFSIYKMLLHCSNRTFCQGNWNSKMASLQCRSQRYEIPYFQCKCKYQEKRHKNCYYFPSSILILLDKYPCSLSQRSCHHCPQFGSLNGDVEQLQGKLIILSKMLEVSNVFKYLISYSFNVDTGEICSVLFNCEGKFFMFLSFIILLMFIMSMPLFTKCNFITFYGLVFVVFDTARL